MSAVRVEERGNEEGDSVPVLVGDPSRSNEGERERERERSATLAGRLQKQQQQLLQFPVEG